MQAEAGSRAVFGGPLLACMAAGPFLSMIDSSVVNVALPDMAKQLDASLSTVQWVASGYLLALAMVLGISAYLAKRFGVTRAYLASLGGFTLASALCALAPSIGVLIAARVLQGALGAPLVPLALSVLLVDDGGSGGQRGVSPVAGIIFFLGPALGPTVGGLLVGRFAWPSIFLINVPLGLLGLLAVARAGDTLGDEGDRGVRLNIPGLLVLAGGLALAVYGASEAQLHGWFARTVWPLWTTGAGLTCLYALWVLRRPHPAVDLKLLRHPQGALSVGLCALVAVVMFAVVILIPTFMQAVQGYSAFDAGLALLPQGLAAGVATALGNRLSARYGVRKTVLSGTAALATGTSALLLIESGTPAWVTAAVLSARGFALGLVIQPLLSALFNISQRLGGSVGIALVFSFFQSRECLHANEVLREIGAGATASSEHGHTHGVPPSPTSRRACARVWRKQRPPDYATPCGSSWASASWRCWPPCSWQVGQVPYLARTAERVGLHEPDTGTSRDEKPARARRAVGARRAVAAPGPESPTGPR